jgi:hypothetical protein
MSYAAIKIHPGLSRLVLLALFLLAAGPAQAQPRDTTTEMVVNSTGTALDISTGSECGNSQKGCKEAKPGQQLKLKMRLEGDRDCKRSGGARWMLDAVYLGGFNSETKPGQRGNLPALVAEDFDVDLATGRVNPQSSSGKKIDFRNDNNNAYSLWYEVTAVCVSRRGQTIGEPISTDPLIRNRGRR